MRIGIFFNAKKFGGGAYQYALAAVEALLSRKADEIILFNASADLPDDLAARPRLKIVTLYPNPGKTPPVWNLFDRAVRKVLMASRNFGLLNLYDARFRNQALIRTILETRPDLMFFTSPHVLAAQLPFPTIAPIHDVQHRLHKNFPEMSFGTPFLNKEYLSSQITRKCAAILVDSPVGKEDIISSYRVPAEKIQILSFLPPDYLNPELGNVEVKKTLEHYNLPGTFLFYPAQFWTHKNHENLVRALSKLSARNIKPGLVLTGGLKNRWTIREEIEELARKLNLEDRVQILGYVENNAMSALYKQAMALIMPTYLGPTNIPVLEAWKMGCPVLYSDVRGCREQAGNAALLFDPKNPDDIADKISKIVFDRKLREELAEKGRKRLNLWTKRDFTDKINQIINTYAP